MNTTTNDFMGGKLTLKQPAEGYRIAIDPIFLASAVPARPGDHVLDVGTGVGVAVMALIRRFPDVKGAGIDKQRDLLKIAEDNLVLNDLQKSITFKHADIKEFISGPGVLEQYHHVMSNPPFYSDAEYAHSPYGTKTLSHGESGVSLQEWIDFCVKSLKEKGTLTLIYPTQYLDRLIKALPNFVGGIQVCPLWGPRQEKTKRVLVQAKKGSKAEMTLHSGFALHEEDGRYTERAQKILREGEELRWGKS